MMMIKLEKEAQELQNKAAAALEKQRDEEIELVIARLEEEAQSTHAQLSIECDAKLARVTEQYQAQVLLIHLFRSTVFLNFCGMNSAGLTCCS